jgi:xanthine dehydrogenase accessory factor
MLDLVSDLEEWMASGEPIALAVVTWAEGPSPRPVGSHMAISLFGQMIGSVSGGCVEGTVLQEAQDVLVDGNPKRLRYGVVDEEGWEVGLACGGTIEVYLELLRPIHERLVTAIRSNETVALVTRLDGPGHLLLWPDGRAEGDTVLCSVLEQGGASETLFSASPPARRLDTAGGEVFTRLYTPPPTLTIFGAVHLAQPLVLMAQAAGFRVRVADGRRAFNTAERFPTADELVVAWPREALIPEYLRPQDALVILTHDPKFDIPALERALQSPVGYIGLLGSQTTQLKRRTVLQDHGFSPADLGRIHGPVGLDLGGREPEEIAVAILAEIVAERHGRRFDAPSAGAPTLSEEV